MNIYNQGLRYWMILYKLLKCFSAQLVAKKIISYGLREFSHLCLSVGTSQ